MAFPLQSQSIYVIGRKLAQIFSRLCERTIFISGNIPEDLDLSCATRIFDVRQVLPDLAGGSSLIRNVLKWVVRNFQIQVLLAIRLVKSREDYDVAVFFLGTQYQIPILATKLLGKKVICGSAGLGGDFAKFNYGGFAATVALMLVNFNYWLSDIIVIESWRLASDKTLNRWRTKLRNGALYLSDPHLFEPVTPLRERDFVIGYVGRFSNEKGILNLVEAIPAMLKTCPELRVSLIGSGPLEDLARKRIVELGLQPFVTLHGWVKHHELPSHINAMQLLVVPSESEGVPNVILEAFGCGTPVLATPVGGVPDLIEDGVTGFILSDLSPREVGKRIQAILGDSYSLEQVAERARIVVKSDYVMDAAVGRYDGILSDLFEEGVTR